MATKKLRVFGGEGCDPCQVLKEMLDSGEISIEGVKSGETLVIEYHDVTKNEEFHFVEDLELENLPAIFLDGRVCHVVLRTTEGAEVTEETAGDQETVAVIACPTTDPPPSSEQG